MTLETLATIKNPPVVFARQANINNGGQQQVNNGTVPQEAVKPAQALMGARAEKPDASQGELLAAAAAGEFTQIGSAKFSLSQAPGWADGEAEVCGRGEESTLTNGRLA